MPGWLTSAQVAAQLHHTPRQPDLDNACAAIVAEIERLRSDIDFAATPPAPTGRYANVHQGALMWVVLIYNRRNSPNGYPNFGEPGGDLYGAIDATSWMDISRLCGLRRPVTA